MKKLIIKTTLVLLPIAIVLILFELMANTIPTSYAIKHNNIVQKKDKIEVLVMGSSHANFGINPEYFGREAFNLSNTSQCLYQDYKVLLKYLPECKNLKVVIIPISYFTLQTDLALSPEAWRCAYYSYYMGVQTDSSLSMFDLRNYSALFLWEGPFGVIKNLRDKKKIDINAYGYQKPEKIKRPMAEIINDHSGKARVRYHDKIMSYNFLSSNMNTLEKIINELRAKNLKIVFVTTPVYETYYQNVSTDNYNVMTNSIDKIGGKYAIKNFNYFCDKRFEIKDFLDNDHLNEEGAKKFSIILKDEVIDQIIRE